MVMPDEPTSAEDAMEDVSAVDGAIVDRLATLDDRLAGYCSGPAADGSAGNDASDAEETCDGSGLNTAIDTILLLRQVAAAERDSGYDPIVLPQRIGRYEIVREAGRGAFAYVLEARDEILHRRVALKVARPEALVSVPFRRRFVREAELAARLIHPNIVSIHEVGEEAGLVFIASEYCAGGDLADWLERHPGAMPARQAAELVRSLATAVAYAHASGIVHRDIKPANVLLVPPPGRPGEPTDAGDMPIAEMTVKLGDFGLGKLFHDRADEGFTQLTRSGSRLGTPAWMAPEQIDQSFGDVGPATDIYALGLLLDRLLTGRCLFRGKTEAEIFRAVLLEDATPPDRVTRHLPRDIAAVSLKCLAKRPADRYASASELAEDLSRFLAHRPTLARPLSAPSKVMRSIARRPLISLLVAAAAGGLLLAVWASAERSREANEHARSQAEKSRLEAAAELRRGFEAWRTGHAVTAVDHLRTCETIDVDLAGSLAGRWLLSRLNGQRDLLLAPTTPPPSHPDLYSLACAHDGSVLAAGGADGRLFILRLTADGAAAEPPLVIEAHDEINDVAFSPDGRLLASAGEDGRLRIWNVVDGSPNREVFQAAGPLFAAAFSPDGGLLACGGAQQSLCLIQTGGEATARELRPFADAVAAGSVAADSDIESLQFIDADRIAMACGIMVAILDVASGVTRMFPGHAGTMGQLAVSRDRTRLLSAGTDREPRVWDLSDGRLLMTLPRHPSWVQGCDFSPDGTTIATGCRDGVVRVFDAATGGQQRQLVGHMGRTWDVKYDPSGMVLSAGADGTLRRWSLAATADAVGMRDVRIPERVAARVPSRGRRCAVGIVETPPGRRSVLLNLQSTTVLVDAATGGVTEFASPSAASSYSIAIDASRRRFAALPRPGLIEVHPLPGLTGTAAGLARPEVFRQLPGTEKDAGQDVIWTPSGMLIAACDGGRLLAWEGELDRVIEVDRFERSVDSVRIAPAGPPRLAIVAGKLLRVYPLPASGPPTGRGAKTIVTLPGDGVIVKLDWSPDGRSIAYGTSDGHVTTVDATTGRAIDTFPKHAREVTGIVWSADGRTLVTADAECIRFSDVATTMTFDEVRPGWNIEDMEFDGGVAGRTSPLLVIAGSAAAVPGGTDREARLGIFDLHHALPPQRVRP